MSQVWQHPFVNVFKHLDVPSWKKASKEGEVTTQMDKTLKCTVYKISGSIPAGNYIQLPKTGSQSLGLTGRYFYLLFRPIPGKYFVVHMDVATSDGLVIRISFSNLFKEFKATSTWLQFPYVCRPAKGSISEVAAKGSKDIAGPAPIDTRFGVLCLNFEAILKTYVSRRFSYLKTVKLCANMMVKNIITSDLFFEPGVTPEQAKKQKFSLLGKAPMPRDMAFPLAKNEKWHDVYDIIRFPPEGAINSHDIIRFGYEQSDDPVHEVIKGKLLNTPQRISPRVVDATKPVRGRPLTKMAAATQPPNPRGPLKKPISQLPRVGVDESGNIAREVSVSENEVHVYATTNPSISIDKESEERRREMRGSKNTSRSNASHSYTSLQPDPIIQLRRIVGFGGASTRDVLWSCDGTSIVYPCHAVVVAMQVSNGHQRFFIGHTDKVAGIAMNGASTKLATGQTGPQSVVRVWNFQSGECLAMFKTHVHSLHSLSMSHSGSVLCGVGKDNHGKNMVVIWDLHKVEQGGQVSVMAKAHTEVDIVRMRISAFDDTRMVSCGRENIRLWRVKDGNLRSAPVNLGEYHSNDFTDCCFDAGYEPTKDPLDRVVYGCSKSGYIFEIDYRKVAILHVRRLLPANSESKKKSSSLGIAINSICVNEAFCATASDDGFLRLWPLDFKQVYLEAEHEGPVTAVHISEDGLKILAGTSTGNVGILDVTSRGYTTVMRSHTARVVSMALDPGRKHLATVALDHSIRVWDLNTMQQLYDFSAPKEIPCAITYHPSQQVFACGFQSGAVRVFDVAATSLLAEHRPHRGEVTGLTYSPDGRHLYSSDTLGSLALYDAAGDSGYHLLRVLAHAVAPGARYGPDALSASPDARALAFVGPTEFTVSVVSAGSLDELVRIDVSTCGGGDHDGTRGQELDTALRVKYAPASTHHLLVTTAKNKLIKLDAANGKVLSELGNIHRSGCTALDVSGDGRHLATAGDKVIKIWDYYMRLDLNFQVFIGHAESIGRVCFAPDQSTFISTGECIFIWDFLAYYKKKDPPLEGRTKATSYYTGEEEEFDPFAAPKALRGGPDREGRGQPRSHVPKPHVFSPTEHIANISAIDKDFVDDLQGEDIVSQASELPEDLEVLDINNSAQPPRTNGHHQEDREPEPIPMTTSGRVQPFREEFPAKRLNPVRPTPEKQQHSRPEAFKHFKPKKIKNQLAQRRYTAPPNQAGLKLESVLGYNGNGRTNMVWQPDTGMFAYSSGCTIIVEELDGGKQQHLHGHHEEISTIALQHGGQVLASAAASRCGSRSAACDIMVWDVRAAMLHKALSHHTHNVQCLAFSRDDRFLVSVGDYTCCDVAVWSTGTWELLVTTRTHSPVHALAWDPSSCNEFASVGSGGSLLFWLLDETSSTATTSKSSSSASKTVSLNVHEAELPAEMVESGQGEELTSLRYGGHGESTLYVGSAGGRVSAWDTRRNACFMHWTADTTEIVELSCHGGRMVTGSQGGVLRLWSGVAGGKDEDGDDGAGITMEDEMALDGGITALAFDDTMDMGIAGTEAGTLWYINWTERTNIRLVSGHSTRILCLSVHADYLATGCRDGSLRVWSLVDREQMLQFQVLKQACRCVAFAPSPSPLGSSSSSPPESLPAVVAGYEDGTLRLFDLDKADMVLKMQPHATPVTAVSFSADGGMILSGGMDGLVAVSSPSTGMTVRVITDHRGAAITSIDATTLQAETMLSSKSRYLSSPSLWLAASADRRVSVWSADWSKDFCQLVDWLTFPAPPPSRDTHDEESLPPTLARFSYEEPDMVVYTGYGMQKQIQFYSLSEKKVLRTAALTHWATSLDICTKTPLIAVGNNERLLKLMDYFEGSFQDFTGHNDAVHLLAFTGDGGRLVSASRNQLMLWQVLV